MSRRYHQPKTCPAATGLPQSRPTCNRRAVAGCLLAVAAWLGGSVETATPASAQEGVIQQVVGRVPSTNHRRPSRSPAGSSPSNLNSRPSSPGLFGRLFGGGPPSASSADDDDEYRKVTPVPDMREPADWSGVPYHEASPRKLVNRDVPIRDPGDRVRPLPSRSQAARTTRSSVARRGTASLSPTVSTPRPIGRSDGSFSKSQPIAKAETEEASRPTPLSRTRSSRRTIAERPSTPSVPDLKVARNPLTTSNRVSDAVELVPKVSRRVIRVESSDSTESSSEKATSRDEASARSVAASSSTSSKRSSRRADLSVASESKSDTTPESDATPESGAAKVTANEGSAGAPLVARRQLPDTDNGSAKTRSAVQSGSSRRTALAETTGSGIRSKRSVTIGPADGSSQASTGSVAKKDTAAADLASDGKTQNDQFTARDNATPSAGIPRALQQRSVSPAGSRQPSPPAASVQSEPMAETTAPAVKIPSIRVTPDNDVSKGAAASQVASELPGIRIVTGGPRRIMIRQTHAFEIRAENRGSIDAEGLVVRTHIPDWADVVDQQASRGSVDARNEGTTRQIIWKIDRLAAGDDERMSVQLRAARSGTQQLDVDWTLVPQKDVVKIHVQEPRLALMIEGPEEVVFGESETYRIRVRNPGDGIAPGVVFTLSPNSEQPQSQPIGDIPAGKEAQFEVELTAQDLGELKINGLAEGELQLKAEADKNVRVLSADLQAVLTGPNLKYQNSDATYQLELTNEGSTASENIQATMTLPIGVAFLNGPKEVAARDNELTWKIDALEPGEKREYQFQVAMNATGRQRFRFECQGTAAGRTKVLLATEVQAIADLVLAVEDPVAPAPINDEVHYNVVIRNRGSKPASAVRAIAQFSHGIEPQAIVGHGGKVVTGQVLIEPIDQIGPGEEIRLTIVAKAHEAGHHRFRAEVRSGDTTLVAEEATHYMATNRERISSRSETSAGPTLTLPR